eukprot:13125605-Alexandrium_andersonii.AAC.1
MLRAPAKFNCFCLETFVAKPRLHLGMRFARRAWGLRSEIHKCELHKCESSDSSTRTAAAGTQNL